MEVKLEPLVFDESTGLPKLPEQYAWHVQDIGVENTVWVQIFEKKEVSRSILDRLFRVRGNVYWDASWRFMKYHGRCGAYKECIRDAAVDIYNQARQAELDNAAVEALVGLYPPKSL